jgi:AcrR family transcriptional regulator
VQARATRRRIVEAAAELFVDQGYAATTFEQIASRAGVAVQTVYFHFGNKRTVLRQVVDMAAVGDDEPVPLLDRPWVAQMRAATDAASAVALWCEQSAVIFARVAPILRIVRDAATTDPDMAAQWHANQQQRRTAHRMLAEHLAERGALRPDVTVEQASDILYALISIELYVLLITDCGWTPDRWKQWTTRAALDAAVRGVPT